MRFGSITWPKPQLQKLFSAFSLPHVCSWPLSLSPPFRDESHSLACFVLRLHRSLHGSMAYSKRIVPGMSLLEKPFLAFLGWLVPRFHMHYFLFLDIHHPPALGLGSWPGWPSGHLLPHLLKPAFLSLARCCVLLSPWQWAARAHSSRPTCSNWWWNFLSKPVHCVFFLSSFYFKNFKPSNPCRVPVLCHLFKQTWVFSSSAPFFLSLGEALAYTPCRRLLKGARTSFC